MKSNVSTLLREFSKVRNAALAGEEVIIVTRGGNLPRYSHQARNRAAHHHPRIASR